MFRCAWIIAVTLGLTADLEQAQEQEDRSEERGESHQAAPKEPFPPIRVELVETDEASKARQSSERESQKREIADLVAQQGMNEATQAINRATQDMAFYSLISTGAVVLGTILLGWTLYETRRMVREAKDTTAAAVEATGHAKRQANLSEKTFENLEQPRLFPQITRGHALMAHEPPPKLVKYTLVNFGRSPAVVVGVRHNFSSIDEAGEFVPTYEVIAPGEKSSNQRGAHWSGGQDEAPFAAGSLFRIQVSYSNGTGGRGETLWRFVISDRGEFILLNEC